MIGIEISGRYVSHPNDIVITVSAIEIIIVVKSAANCVISPSIGIFPVKFTIG